MSVTSQDYHNVVEEFAMTGRNFPISNGMPDNAFFLMTLMFRQAKRISAYLHKNYLMKY